jgi:probable phosphoglycerate mutase
MAACGQYFRPAPCAVQCSPQRRARQSAGIIASCVGLPVEIVTAMDEIDFGDWSGCAFEELAERPDWRRWNSHRGTSRPPKGESMRQLQQRVVRHLEQLRQEQGDGAIVIVSHAEPIRAALLHYARLPLDNFLSIAVDPASISTLSFDHTGAHVRRINQKVPA